MSFSTPAMTGINDVGDKQGMHQNMRIGMSNMKLQAQPSVYNPWQSGMQTLSSPWQFGPQPTSTQWQTGSPVMMNPWHTNVSPFQNLPDCQMSNLGQTQSGLAPVDIRVLSESNMIQEKSTDDKNAKNVQITWNSAEELANALFPEKKETPNKTQRSDSGDMGKNRRRQKSQNNDQSIGSDTPSKTLRVHADALDNHKKSIEALHNRTSMILKRQEEKIDKHQATIADHNVNFNRQEVKIDKHQAAIADHKKHILDLLAARNKLETSTASMKNGVQSMKKTQETALANHKHNIEALASVVRVNNNKSKEHSEALIQHKKIIEGINNEILQLKKKADGAKFLSSEEKFDPLPKKKSLAIEPMFNPENLKTFSSQPLLAPRRKCKK